MKKILTTLTASSLLTLAACGGGGSSSTTINPVNPADAETPVSRVSFQPASGVLSVPSDLLFAGTQDGTLEPPDEVAGKAAGNVNFGSPSVALGGLAGWSRQVPFKLAFDMVEGTTVAANTVAGKVVVFEATASAGNPADPNCPSTPAGLPCAPVAQLTEGVDFVVSPSADGLTVVPVGNLKPGTVYVLGLLNGIEDSRGELVAASETYEIVTSNTDLSNNSSLAGLQGAIAVYQGVIQAASGGAISADDFIYSMAMTTQGVAADFTAIKAVMKAAPPVINVVDTGVTVRAAFQSATGTDPGAAFDTVDYYSGSINLPYYLATPTMANPMAPLTQQWQAACDSGVRLARATVDELANATPGANHALCQTLGLADLGLDTERHVTRYNPYPQPTANVAVDVQMTVPAAGCGGPCSVVILQHGITSTKEAMLLMTASLGQAGFATIAIDHPLHGSRGFDVDGDMVDDINASTVSATHYMNLAYLMVARDNLRQSTSAMLGLRFGLQNFTANDGTTLDTTDVHVAGLSLGAISATSFAAMANASVDADYNIGSASLNSPGGGVAALLAESPSFGPLVQSSVLAAAGTDLSAEFTTFLAAPAASCAAETPATEAYQTCQYEAFVAQLTADNETAKLAELSSTMASFVFAAQTILDAGDPNSFAAILVASATPVHMTEIVGDGAANLPDQVIPNQTTKVPFGGTEPLARLLGLAGVNPGPAASGIVRFTEGSHSSLLDPSSSAAVTTEMQTEVATFFAAGAVVVSNNAVVAAP